MKSSKNLAIVASESLVKKKTNLCKSFTPNKSNKMKALVVSSEAGGANQLLHFVLNHKSIKNYSKFYFLKEPALSIFKKKLKFKNLNLSSTLKKISEFDLVICSNGYQGLEKIVMFESLNKNIKTWVVFDHWVRYEERLNYKNRNLAPEKIIVSDKNAQSLAKKQYNLRVELVKNYYLESIRSEFTSCNVSTNAIYIAEPENCKIKDTKKEWESFQFSSLMNELSYIESIGILKRNNIKKLIIRLHHYLKKIKNLKKIKSFELESSDKPIEKSLSEVNICIGKTSYALYIASKLKLKTYSISKGLYNRELCIPSNIIKEI